MNLLNSVAKVLILIIVVASLVALAQPKHSHSPTSVEFWNNFRVIPRVKILSVDDNQVNYVFVGEYEDGLGHAILTNESDFRIQKSGVKVDREYFKKHLKQQWGFFYCDLDKEAFTAFELD